MHSSSPNILKHYVPLSFSKSLLDYKGSQKKRVEKEQESPFKNKKLRQIQQKPKDYVLVYKNKTNKCFRSKKQIQFIPLLKNMKIAHKNYIVMQQKQKKTYKLLLQNDPMNHFKSKMSQDYQKLVRSKTASSKKLKNRFVQSPSNRTKISTERLIHTSYKPLRQSFPEQHLNYLEWEFPTQIIKAKNQQDLKITGFRAPSSEMFSPWRKSSTDTIHQYYSVDKYIRSN